MTDIEDQEPPVKFTLVAKCPSPLSGLVISSQVSVDPNTLIPTTRENSIIVIRRGNGFTAYPGDVPSYVVTGCEHSEKATNHRRRTTEKRFLALPALRTILTLPYSRKSRTTATTACRQILRLSMSKPDVNSLRRRHNVDFAVFEKVHKWRVAYSFCLLDAQTNSLPSADILFLAKV
jgi:hypothetical protein